MTNQLGVSHLFFPSSHSETCFSCLTGRTLSAEASVYRRNGDDSNLLNYRRSVIFTTGKNIYHSHMAPLLEASSTFNDSACTLLRDELASVSRKEVGSVTLRNVANECSACGVGLPPHQAHILLFLVTETSKTTRTHRHT